MSKRYAAMYLTRKLKLGHTDQLDRLAQRAGICGLP